jgi:hypothetical protein
MDKITNMVSWRVAKDADQRSTEQHGPGPFRARFELAEEERANQRRLELAVQRSDLSSPDERIRSWEKLHGLRLPSDSAHPVLDVIAASTRLTLAEVKAEQRARASRAAARLETESS